MPSTNELPRWYKALKASDSFHWDIYKRPVEPAYPCYAIQIDVYGIEHGGYCSGYSDDVDDYLDDKKENGEDEEEEYQNKLQSTSYTAWLPLTDSDGKPWDFEINRFKDPSMPGGCYSESGSGYCHIEPVVMLTAAVKIDK